MALGFISPVTSPLVALKVGGILIAAPPALYCCAGLAGRVVGGENVVEGVAEETMQRRRRCSGGEDEVKKRTK